jgi:prevent-host-death family protein
MRRIGAFAAKTHLGQLLERVAQGEKVLITRRGKPVAMLVPPEDGVQVDVAAVVREMLACRDRCGPRLGKGLTMRELREEGRRF